MSMNLYTNIGPYIRIETSDKEALSNLRSDLSEVFGDRLCIPGEYVDNIIIPNESGHNFYYQSENDEAEIDLPIYLYDIENGKEKFINSYRDIIDHMYEKFGQDNVLIFFGVTTHVG